MLFRGLILADSKIEIKCKKCGKIVSLGDLDPLETEHSHFAMLFDSRGNIVTASTTTEKILEYSADELKKMTIFDLAKKSSPESYAKLWETSGRSTPNRLRY